MQVLLCVRLFKFSNHIYPLLDMSRPTWEVLVLPAAGEGRSYWESVEAQNGLQAKKIILSRIPDGWKVGNNPRRA